MAISSSVSRFVSFVSVLSVVVFEVVEMLEFLAALAVLALAGVWFVVCFVAALLGLYPERPETQGWDCECLELVAVVEVEPVAVVAVELAAVVAVELVEVGGVEYELVEVEPIAVVASCSHRCSGCAAGWELVDSVDELPAGCQLVSDKRGRRLGGAVLAGRVRRLVESGELVLA
jgi:hypothetical protein